MPMLKSYLPNTGPNNMPDHYKTLIGNDEIQPTDDVRFSPDYLAKHKALRERVAAGWFKVGDLTHYRFAGTTVKTWDGQYEFRRLVPLTPSLAFKEELFALLVKYKANIIVDRGWYDDPDIYKITLQDSPQAFDLGDLSEEFNRINRF